MNNVRIRIQALIERNRAWISKLDSGNLRIHAWSRTEGNVIRDKGSPES